MDELLSSKERRSTFRLLMISTIIYLILFPIVVFISLLGLMMTSKYPMLSFMGGSFIILILSIPLSILISILFMWLRYFQMQYLKANFHCGVPILVAMINFFLIGVLRFF